MKTEIDNFFERVLNYDYSVSKQAYFAARSKLTVEAFSMLFDTTIKVALGEYTQYKKWRGYRVAAIDGTTLTLEDTPSLRGYFGVCGGEDCAPAARVSTLTDVLNSGIIIDAQIDQYKRGERDLAMIHHQKLVEHGASDKFIIIYDRGYISEELLRDFTQKDIKFLCRVKRRQYPQVDRQRRDDAQINLLIKKNTYRVRVIKIELDTGETETLITNLTGALYPYSCFKELYALRWGIETSYHTIKEILKAEIFSGTSQLLVLQDFFATMTLKNVLAFTKMECNAQIESTANPDDIHKKQTNENLLVGVMKDKLIMALLDSDPIRREKRIMKIIAYGVHETIPIRPGRRFPHRKKHNSPYPNSKKSAL